MGGKGRGKGRGRVKKGRDADRFGKKRSRYLDGVKEIEPNNYDLLQKFLTEHGKIIPSRLTGATAKQQRQIRRGIRRARVMGLVS